MTTVRFLRSLSACLFISVLWQPSVADLQGREPRGLQPSFDRTRLEARTYSGGDLDSSFPWVRSLTVTSPARVYFRWRTTEADVTSAEWQLTDSSTGFSGQPGIIGSGPGALTHSAEGTGGQFSVVLSAFLSQDAPAVPKSYHLRLVPRKGRIQLAPSSSVMITHQKAGPTPVLQDFSLSRFEQNLTARLASEATGFAYAIYKHDALVKAGSGGYAVLPNIPHSPDRRTTMLSMSKTITAAAVLKAMEQMRAQGQRITIDSPIAPFLPSNWAQGRHVAEMTFRHLLTHTSGLRGVDVDPDTNDVDTYINLRQAIANGATDANFGMNFYANANFCLFRVILPYMTSDRSVLQAVENNTDFIARHTGVTYATYVHRHVLQPIGLGDIEVIPTGPVPYTRYTSLGPTSITTAPVDETAVLRGGAGYWYMSAKEFGAFIVALRHHDRIISAESFAL